MKLIAFILLSMFSSGLVFSTESKISLVQGIAENYGPFNWGVQNPEVDTQNNCHIKITSDSPDNLKLSVWDHLAPAERVLELKNGSEGIHVDKENKITVKGDDFLATMHLKKSEETGRLELEKVSIAKTFLGFKYDEFTCHAKMIGDGSSRRNARVSNGSRDAGKDVGSAKSATRTSYGSGAANN